MTNTTIEEIERALKLHINYRGIPSNGKYLNIMDSLTWGYTGAPAIKVSKLLDNYYKEVEVSNLEEALQRLRNQENQ